MPVFAAPASRATCLFVEVLIAIPDDLRVAAVVFIQQQRRWTPGGECRVCRVLSIRVMASSITTSSITPALQWKFGRVDSALVTHPLTCAIACSIASRRGRSSIRTSTRSFSGSDHLSGTSASTSASPRTHTTSPTTSRCVRPESQGCTVQPSRAFIAVDSPLGRAG